jgi:Flp pilus assembly protein TadB
MGAVIWWVCVPVGVVLILHSVWIVVRMMERRKIRRMLDEMMNDGRV